MGQFEQLDQLLETQDGMLRTAQVVSAGISKPVFYDYVHSRELERVAHGIYLSKDAWVDAMYLLHLRVEQAVYSHETALFFHDLTDREPLEYTVTVKTGYNPSKLKAEGVQLNKDDYELVYEGIVGEFRGNATIDGIFTQFNTNHPEDFRGHSLSVSDVIVISLDDKDTAYYCDSFGFTEMPEFFLEKERTSIPSKVMEPPITLPGD